MNLSPIYFIMFVILNCHINQNITQFWRTDNRTHTQLINLLPINKLINKCTIVINNKLLL